MLASNLVSRADMLIQKINHYLISIMGRSAREASNREFFYAFSYALREEVMLNWARVMIPT
jgi:glycogen phosphorylase